MAHRIRLRKPWTRHDNSVSRRDVVGSSNGLDMSPDGLLVDVPDQSTGDISSIDSVEIHSTVYRRRFNRPSGLQTNTQVQLEIGEVIGHFVEVRLNSAVIVGLDAHSTLPAKWDITAQIAASNQLEIEIAAEADANISPRLIGEVNLWIVDQG